MLCRALLAALLCLVSWAIAQPSTSVERFDASDGQASIASAPHDQDDSQSRWEALRRASVPLPTSQWKPQLHAELPAFWSWAASRHRHDNGSITRSSDRAFPHLDRIPLLI